MAGRPDFSTPGSQGSGQHIAINDRPELQFVEDRQTASLASGANETVEVYAPTGSIYRMKALQLYVAADATATTGDHQMKAAYEIAAGTDLEVLRGKSTYNSNIYYIWGQWQTADLTSEPTDATAQHNAQERLQATENRPFKFVYSNNTDAAQDNERRYFYVLEEVSY